MTTSMNYETRRPGQVAGLAPSATDVSRARRGQWLALAIYGIPLILLMIGLYVRLFASAERLGFHGLFGSIFGYLFPLIVVTVLAALLWALVVEPYSRGNTLGDHLRSQEQVDEDTARRDEELLADGRESALEAKKHAEAVRTALISADEEVADMAGVGHRGLQIAHAALGVGTIGWVRPENMTTQAFPQRLRIEHAAAAQAARSELSAEALEQYVLPELGSLDSPHLIYTTPPSVVPDLAFVVPATMAPYAGSTLGFDDEQVIDEARPSRSRRAIVGAAVAALLLAGAGIYFLADHSSAVASVGTPATGNGALLEGVDYSYGSRAADGSIVRWDCTTPITVRLAGTAPAGAGQAVAEAVQELKSKSNLPLVVGAALPNSVIDSKRVPANEIIYNYLTSQQIAAAGLDLTGDRLGLGGAQYDESERVTSGWVGIRSDEPATDPTTTTGREVTWHEGAHALNVGHSAQNTSSPEIMAPVMDPVENLAWGPGDSLALASVGCPSPSAG